MLGTAVEFACIHACMHACVCAGDLVLVIVLEGKYYYLKFTKFRCNNKK